MRRIKNLKIVSLLRSQIYLVLILTILFDEFDQLTFWFPPLIYSNIFGGFRFIDFLCFLIFSEIFIYRIVIFRGSFKIVKSINKSLLIFAFAILISVILTLIKGSFNIFFGWKNLFLGVLFFYSFINAFNSEKEIETLLKCIFNLVFFKSIYSLILYMLGYGLYTLDKGYVPILFPPSITFVVFINLLALSYLLFGNETVSKKVLLCLTIGVTLFLIIFSLSRIDWGIYSIGLLTIFIILSFRKKITYFIFLITLFFLIQLFFPGEFQRAMFHFSQILELLRKPQSFRLESVTMHWFDIIEALDQIKQHPILGIGVGVPYETKYVYLWKTVSYGVHNGFLNTWFKFGLLGAIAYIMLFLRFLLTGFKILFIIPINRRILLIAPLGTGLGMWIMSFLFAPSNFENFQKSILVFFCMAVVFILENLTRKSIKL